MWTSDVFEPVLKKFDSIAVFIHSSLRLKDLVYIVKEVDNCIFKSV